MDLIKEQLQVITELSHEFGTEDYVKGGGGNTSCKTADRLWVKPSGTTLGGLNPASFVEMEREKIQKLFEIQTPEDPAEREALVKDVMENSRVEGATGRASVEAPLHHSLNYTYVVHTHPVLVNALTCSQFGKRLSSLWFPDALWIDYIDPGYTLSVYINEKIEVYEKVHDKHPQVIILQNHGIFVAANDAEGIRLCYAQVMEKLQQEIGDLSLELGDEGEGAEAYVTAVKNCLPKDQDWFLSRSKPFSLACANITPDHMVYMKSRAFYGVPTPKSLDNFVARYGYLPKVFVGDDAVVAVADSERSANLALSLAQDAAQVIRGARSFGGVKCMSEAAVDFIENWEVESYRQKQMA